VILCVHCGKPVKWVRTAGGWLHAAPLGEFRISRREADDVHADPPRRGHQPLHRQTVIHPAQPER
jgi:hypothetical protein